tara:strand:+ start:19186 stop:19869 length:684 start_codon:yes stop_codon:yes gene_type:complete
LNFIDYSSFFNNSYLTAVISKRDRNYAIKSNRVKFIESLKINSETIIFPQQVHSNNVKIIDKVKFYKETDGLLSLSDSLGIGILVADCVPVFLYGIKSNHCALIHSGWKGSANLITTNAINKLIDLGNFPSEIKAVLGPSIGKCCFEIGSDVAQYFSKENLSSEKGSKFKLDLKNEIFSELINLGLAMKNIYLDTHCTFCDKEKFFSYRREGIDSGRMVAIMKVKTL